MLFIHFIGILTVFVLCFIALINIAGVLQLVAIRQFLETEELKRRLNQEGKS
ncbi:MAG: hypothetical protein N2C14_31450 [Planctomycetales bacterium]